MATKSDLISELDTNLNVLSREQTMRKEHTADAVQYSYRVVHEENGLAKVAGYHILVQNEGQNNEQAWFMEREPAWRRSAPQRTDLTEQEVKDYIANNISSLNPVQVEVNNRKKFAKVTVWHNDTANDQIVEKQWAVQRDGSGGYIAKPLQEK